MVVDLGPLHFSIGGWFLLVLVLMAFVLVSSLRKRHQTRQASFGGLETDEAKSVRELKRFTKKASLKKHQVIATVTVSGPILTSPVGAPSFMINRVTYGEDFAALLDHLSGEGSIAAIIVRFSTPGGTVPGSRLIADAIKRCRGKKPVFAYISDLSASGGVMAMVAAEKVFAAPGALTGSIGVIGPTLIRYNNVTERKGILGAGVVAQEITGKTLYAGHGKNLGDPFASEAEFNRGIESFQGMIAETYSQFVAHVTAHRNIREHDLIERGAMIFNTQSAQRLGLIDGVATVAELRAYVMQRLKIASEATSFVTLVSPQQQKRPLGISAQLLQYCLPYAAHQELHRTLTMEPQLLIDARYLQQ